MVIMVHNEVIGVVVVVVDQPLCAKLSTDRDALSVAVRIELYDRVDTLGCDASKTQVTQSLTNGKVLLLVVRGSIQFVSSS